MAGVEVLEHDLPLAYCVPGLGANRVVVSAGALGRLSGDEFHAVLAHERAHLAARHDLVLEAFTLLWTPAKEATVPNIVREEQLPKVNSLGLAAHAGVDFRIGQRGDRKSVV